MKPFKFSKKKHEYIRWSKNVTEVRTVQQAARDDSGAAPLQVDMDEGAAGGVYANMAVITHTDAEFTLDFLFLRPDRPEARVRARVISGPAHIKRLCAALEKSLKNYETRFGAIRTGTD